ncbi:hypothetical protein C8R43DRAFT_19280 [Mycena crocata]|nr:hypothetical protein C8R43DRAFT_19280 [Mycena crocata]
MNVNFLLRQHAYHLEGLQLLDENQRYSMANIEPFSLPQSAFPPLASRSNTSFFPLLQAGSAFSTSQGFGSFAGLSSEDVRTFLVALNCTTLLPRLVSLHMLQENYTIDRVVTAALHQFSRIQARVPQSHSDGSRDWDDVGDVQWMLCMT